MISVEKGVDTGDCDGMDYFAVQSGGTFLGFVIHTEEILEALDRKPQRGQTTVSMALQS
jgi:hypothetical protein